MRKGKEQNNPIFCFEMTLSFLLKRVYFIIYKVRIIDRKKKDKLFKYIHEYAKKKKNKVISHVTPHFYIALY